MYGFVSHGYLLKRPGNADLCQHALERLGLRLRVVAPVSGVAYEVGAGHELQRLNAVAIVGHTAILPDAAAEIPFDAPAPNAKGRAGWRGPGDGGSGWRLFFAAGMGIYAEIPPLKLGAKRLEPVSP